MATALITPGQVKDLSSALVQAIPTDLPSVTAQDWVGRKGNLIWKTEMILRGCDIIPPDINWPLTYEKLGMGRELAVAEKKLVLPQFVNPTLWYARMVCGVTSNRVIAAYREFKVNAYTYRDDLDADVTQNDRDPSKGSYIVGFRRTIEADEEFADKSANQLVEVNHRGITLCERLVLGFGFFVTTGMHLDTRTWTLCAGSRDRDGYVPGVFWGSDSRGVYVSWFDSGDAHGHVRSRSVVS